MKTIFLISASIPLGFLAAADAGETLLKNIAEKCTIDTQYASISACPAGEDTAFETYYDRKGIVAALTSIGKAFNQKDEKLSAVALKFAYQYRTSIKPVADKPASLPGKVTEDMIGGLEKNQNYAAMYSAELATYLATLHKKEDKLLKIVEKHAQEGVRTNTYPYLMTYGRLRNYDKLKQVIQKSKVRYEVAAALYAPEYMYNFTAAEVKKVCGDYKAYLASDDADKVRYAARLFALRCGSEYIDLMLDRAETLNTEGKLKGHMMVEALRNFTFSCETYMGQPPTGSEQQCARKKALVDSLQ